MERGTPIDGKTLVPLDEAGSDDLMDDPALERALRSEPKPPEEVVPHEQ